MTRSTSSASPAARWLGCALAALTACAGEAPEPTWSTLAEAQGAAAYAESSRGTWFSIPLAREDFTPGLVDGFWKIDDPLLGSDLPIDHEVAPTLEGGGKALEYRENVGLNAELRALLQDTPETGAFFFYAKKLQVVLPPPGELPETLELRAFVNADTVSGARARTRTGLTIADGFSIFPGKPLELHADLPADAALSFSLAALAPFEGAGGSEEGRFRIEVDGSEVFSWSSAPAASYAPVLHRVTLPPAAHAGARWRFEATGPQALWSVGTPMVTPAVIGAPSARPWGAERPSMIVFLADTLRADALGAYGADAEVTPNLDAFAEASATFLRAWSPSSWTLPSHASLFSGVFPYQHGARRKGLRFGTGLETLGERFAAEGYRTGAVTDGLFVSRRWGLDRGFDWFRENAPSSLEATLEGVQEFLDADDGRPFLLFVQSYHAHGPYILKEETLAEHGERLGITETWEELMARVTAVMHDEGILSKDGPGLDPDALFSLLQRSTLNDTLHEMTSQFQGIYHGRVLELDEAFGQFLAELERRDLRRNSYVVFTSDHGEGFGEHGKLFHGSGVWDEVLRIPLIVSGPEVDAGERTFGASLVDIAPTLTDAAGIDPAPTWLGASLLDLDRDRPVFAFDCAQHTEPLAVWVDGEFKVAVPAGEPGTDTQRDVRYLFDLERDPAELSNLFASPPEGAVEQMERMTAALEALLHPLDASGGEAQLDEDMIEKLRAMGYADQGERPNETED